MFIVEEGKQLPLSSKIERSKLKSLFSIITHDTDYVSVDIVYHQSSKLMVLSTGGNIDGFQFVSFVTMEHTNASEIKVFAYDP